MKFPLKNAHSFILLFHLLQEATKLSISLWTKSKRTRADEAWWGYTDYSKTPHTPRITLPLRLQSTSIGHGFWVCSIGSHTHSSPAAQRVNGVTECIQILHTQHTSTWAQQTEILTIHPTQQLFTTVRSIKNNMSQFEEKNISNYWTPPSPSLPAEKTQRRLSSADRWRTDCCKRWQPECGLEITFKFSAAFGMNWESGQGWRWVFRKVCFVFFCSTL